MNDDDGDLLKRSLDNAIDKEKETKYNIPQIMWVFSIIGGIAIIAFIVFLLSAMFTIWIEGIERDTVVEVLSNQTLLKELAGNMTK